MRLGSIVTVLAEVDYRRLLASGICVAAPGSLAEVIHPVSRPAATRPSSGQQVGAVGAACRAALVCGQRSRGRSVRRRGRRHVNDLAGAGCRLVRRTGLLRRRRDGTHPAHHRAGWADQGRARHLAAPGRLAAAPGVLPGRARGHLHHAAAAHPPYHRPPASVLGRRQRRVPRCRVGCLPPAAFWLAARACPRRRAGAGVAAGRRRLRRAGLADQQGPHHDGGQGVRPYGQRTAAAIRPRADPQRQLRDLCPACC